MTGFNTIDEILADFRLGKMAVLMDDEDRENEGDLIMAADCVRPEDVNFMARYGRGLICLTLTRERCRQLRLPLMVSDTDLSHRTNFTLSIEAAEGGHHGDLGARSGAYGDHRGGAERESGGSAPTGSYFSAHGSARRRADPRGSHGSGLRLGAAGRVLRGGHDRRDLER